MNISRLKSFIVVAEELSISKAAKKLYISQPVLSRQIRQLEEELGVELFIRDKSGISLTPAGKVFFPDAKDVVHRMENIKNKIRFLDSNQTESLSFVICPFFSESKYMTLVRNFSLQNPDIKTLVNFCKLDEELTSLIRGDVDISFLPFIDNEVIEEGLIIKRLGDFPMRLVCSVQNPISKEKKLRLDDLKDQTLSSYHNVKNQGKEKALFRIAERFNRFDEYDDWEAYFARIVFGNNLTIMPQFFIRKFQGNLCELNVEDFNLSSSFSAAWLKSNANPAIRRFSESIVSE